MYYSCEEEYNDAMSGAAEADLRAQFAIEIQNEIENLESQKAEIQNQIDQLLIQLSKL
jgi:uncharacterized protein YceH (UPF0502 family)